MVTVGRANGGHGSAYAGICSPQSRFSADRQPLCSPWERRWQWVDARWAAKNRHACHRQPAAGKTADQYIRHPRSHNGAAVVSDIGNSCCCGHMCQPPVYYGLKTITFSAPL